jgi:tetratricopeptide (TPR) repeat protein
LTDLLVQERQPSRAIERAQQSLAKYPGDASAHVILGSLYLQANRIDAARAEFEHAIQINPRLIQGYLQLGHSYEAQGRIPDAIEAYRKALIVQPGFVPLQALIGNLYLDQGDLDAARKYYEEALALDPNFAIAAGNLAWVYLKRGSNIDVALSLAQKAKQLLPELDSISDTLALAYYKKGLYASAIPLLRECVRKAPHNPAYRFHLGMALLAAGDKARGRQQLQTALRLQPRGDDAEAALRALSPN